MRTKHINTFEQMADTSISILLISLHVNRSSIVTYYTYIMILNGKRMNDVVASI